MKLVPNARRILLHSFSIHMTAWGLVLLVAATLVPLLSGRHLLNPEALLYTSALLLALTIPGRVIAQGLGSGERRPNILRSLAISALVVLGVYALSAAVARAEEPTLLALAAPPLSPPVEARAAPTWQDVAPVAVPLVARWEGLRTTAYLDTIASPPVWTVCYGETDNVTPGETRTEAECLSGLQTGLHRYWTGWRNSLPEAAVMAYLTPHRDAAFASFAWNIGVAGAARSTATARLVAGDIAGACEAMTWWNRAGGIIIRGLVNRRSEERDYCMMGLS